MLETDHVAMRTWRVTPDLMCIIDAEGRFLAVNPAWEATLGWPEAEMVGAPFPRFLHPGDAERSLRAFEEIKRGIPVLRFENRYLRADGGHRWLSWVAVPEGDLAYCTIRDVTDDKARDRTIDEQRAEAGLREQFLAILGHDLRNPVGAMTAGVRLLGKQPQSERSRDLLRHMQASALRMSELIDNMMDFARVRLGDGIGLDRRASPDLGARIAELVREVGAAFPDARIVVSADLEAPVHCDGPRIMQVLSNLLGNAVAHGRPGEPIEVDVAARDGRLRLSVANRGTAIPAADLRTLFQPFFKGEPRASPQGLGLGLYICAQIAAAHGGALSVASDAEETRFTLDIPAEADPAAAGEGQPAAGAAGSGS